MSTAGPVNIIDHDTVSMDLTVDESHTILDLDVTLNITHTYVSDMSFWLDAPDGTRIQLVQGATGFPTGANFVDTRFDDEADADFAYSSGMSNYTGSWRPLGNLSDFDGLDVQGTWTLVALDNQDADQGMINDFSLTVTHDVDDAAGDNPGVPASIVFHGSYPNPFNPSTMLSFELSGLAHVQLQVFNSLGQQVATLIDGVKQAGQHSVEFDASALSSGIYFARFSAGDFVSTKKMVLMR
jgi:subtilisin-like proprotein convertase family protein